MPYTPALGPLLSLTTPTAPMSFPRSGSKSNKRHGNKTADNATPVPYVGPGQHPGPLFNGPVHNVPLFYDKVENGIVETGVGYDEESDDAAGSGEDTMSDPQSGSDFNEGHGNKTADNAHLPYGVGPHPGPVFNCSVHNVPIFYKPVKNGIVERGPARNHRSRRP